MSNKNPAISIIIPVYNGEEHLNECLESVIHQRLRNIEIIIINDGSTDSSGKIIATYKDKRITVLTQENQGRMKARANGLSVAKGEYIAFLDCDDYISDSMYLNMYNVALRKNMDIVSCGFINIDEQGREIQRVVFNNNFDEVRTQRILSDCPPSLCNSIFHNFLFHHDEIQFVNLSRGEDLAVVPCLFYYAHNTFMMDESYYYYRNTPSKPRYLSDKPNDSKYEFPTNLLKDLDNLADLFEAGRILADFFLDKDTSASDLIPYTLKFPDFFNRYNYKYVKDYFDSHEIWEWYITYLIEFLSSYPQYYEALKLDLKFENRVVVSTFERVLSVNKNQSKQNTQNQNIIFEVEHNVSITVLCETFTKKMDRALSWEWLTRIKNKLGIKT